MLEAPTYRHEPLADLMLTATMARTSVEALTPQAPSFDRDLALDVAVDVVKACESEITRRSVMAWASWALGAQG